MADPTPSPSPQQEAARALADALEWSRGLVADAHAQDHHQRVREAGDTLLALLSEEREEPPQFDALIDPVLRALDSVPKGDGFTRLHFEACQALSKLALIAEKKAAPSEVETAPPSAICCDGDAYELVDWPQELSKVGQGYLLWRPDGVVMPLGEHTAKRFLVGSQWAGAALYRLRVEPQPPVSRVIECEGKVVPHENTLRINVNLPQLTRWKITLTELPDPTEVNHAAETLTQGGEKS